MTRIGRANWRITATNLHYGTQEVNNRPSVIEGYFSNRKEIEVIEHAICRGCGKKLIGDPYYRNKALLAYTEDGKQCKINFYGGFVCDEICDKRATREMDDSIDAHNDPSGFYRRKAELNNPWD